MRKRAKERKIKMERAKKKKSEFVKGKNGEQGDEREI